MKILNFGSLNIDHVYQVEHIVRPGETLPSSAYQVFAGGKGANQSAALGRAGAQVFHAGRVGSEGQWLVDKLSGLGVDMRLTLRDEAPTGHALIQVDREGHNAIVLFAGCNARITEEQIDQTLAEFGRGDMLLLQNEINNIPHLMLKARERGMKICFNPAPFTKAVRDYPLELVDILVVNELEGAGLSAAQEPRAILEVLVEKYPQAKIALTLGENGALYTAPQESFHVPALRVKAVDTTAAGDTFIGYFLAGLAADLPPRQAVERATRAAALCVTRPGAMDSIPGVAELA
ncbi:MAG: ribokinase [Candidatus Latescibacteria bacterium]|nr:ribokinase [Candidatus Latescibacterota bacterium]